MVGETTGLSEVPNQTDKGQEEIAASGDALVIADAIYGGFELLAAALDRLTASLNGEEEGEATVETYLDGSRIR